MEWSLASLEKHLLIGSTLVEGSTLSETEASHILAGRTVSGHPVQELRELLNYRAAVEWLIAKLASVPFLSVDLLLGFHLRLFAGFGVPAGTLKTHRNFTFRLDGSKHSYLDPSATPEAMRRWTEGFNADPQGTPPHGAARLYGSFQTIHPFDDGNGRIGRVLIAYWLHWKHRKAYTFYARDKIEHLKAVEATNRGDFGLLERFFEDRIVDEGP